MDKYSHILLVTNCAKNDEEILIKKISTLITPQLTRLSLVYIIPTIPPYYLQCPASLELEKQLKANAEKKLMSFIEKIGLDGLSYYVKEGDYEREINSLADELGADLIVIAKAPVLNLFKHIWQKLLHITPNNKHKKLYTQ